MDAAVREQIYTAIRTFTCATVAEAEEATQAIIRLTANAEANPHDASRLREALEDIAIYGCGMLNQPAAMNGPEEEWLRRRIAEYERRARAALATLPQEAKPNCPYCGTTEGLRIADDGGGYEPPDYICEDCFTPRDEGPCFDDLPLVKEA